MKINQNFLGGRAGGCKTENVPWGEDKYFLELYNLWGGVGSRDYLISPIGMGHPKGNGFYSHCGLRWGIDLDK